MPDTPNYKSTQVGGESWIRSSRLIIDNPLGGLPSMMFVEEEVSPKSGGRNSFEPVSNINVVFDQENPLHIQAYTVLNAIYVEEREKRDNVSQIPS